MTGGGGRILTSLAADGGRIAPEPRIWFPSYQLYASPTKIWLWRICWHEGRFIGRFRATRLF